MRRWWLAIAIVGICFWFFGCGSPTAPDPFSVQPASLSIRVNGPAGEIRLFRTTMVLTLYAEPPGFVELRTGNPIVEVKGIRATPTGNPVRIHFLGHSDIVRVSVTP
jgi:hypothetical protein